MPHRNSLSGRTIVHIKERGQASESCKESDSVKQSSLRSNDAGCSWDESYEDMKICEVNKVIRDEDYVSHAASSVVRDVETSNEKSSYEGRKDDWFEVKPTDEMEQDLSDPRSLWTADLYVLIEANVRII
jgi:hypothetical protein